MYLRLIILALVLFTAAPAFGPKHPCRFEGCKKPGSSSCKYTLCGDHCKYHKCPRHGGAQHREELPEIVRITPKNNNRCGKGCQGV